MYTGQEAKVNEVNAKSKSLQLQLLYFIVSHITGPVGSRHLRYMEFSQEDTNIVQNLIIKSGYLDVEGDGKRHPPLMTLIRARITTPIFKTLR